MTHERVPGTEEWADLPDATASTPEPLPGVAVGDPADAVTALEDLPVEDPVDPAHRAPDGQQRASGGGTVVIQRGHCFRREGATGTTGEQEFVDAVGREAAALLERHGHRAVLLGADEPVPRADVFLALHCDGSVHATAGGASAGYRDAAGRDLAARWKAAYQRRGWPHGFRGDNYTEALRFYYGTRWAARAGIPRAVVVEHGFLTNPSERRFLTSPAGRAVAVLALVDAVGAVLGHPDQDGTGTTTSTTTTGPEIPTTDEQDWLAMATSDELRDLIDERIRHFGLHEAAAHARQARDAANFQGEKGREAVREEAAKVARQILHGLRFHGDRTLAQHVVDLRRLINEARGEARAVRRLVEAVAAAQGLDIADLARQIAGQLDVPLPQGAGPDDVLDRLAERLAAPD